MSTMDMLFVGREPELAAMDQLYSTVGDRGAVVCVEGEPGIGKSAFLSISSGGAASIGLNVLRVTGIAGEAHLPFAGLHQVLSPLIDYADVLPPPQRHALLSSFGMTDDEAPAPPNLFVIALATLTLLAECSSRRPILIVIDDFQWLDQPTIDVFAFLSRRIRSDPIILLAAYREGYSCPLDDDAIRIKLQGLGEDAAKSILASVAPGLSARRVHQYIRQAAGNPLALIELPRSARPSASDDPMHLPISLRLERAFSGRISDLPLPAQNLLRLAAENDSSSVREILEAGRQIIGEDVDISSLTPAVSAGLIRIDRNEIVFRHPLVRSAIHQSIDLGTRHALHAALATVLKDEPARYAWHLAGSIFGPDERVACELDQMAEHSLRRGGVTTAISALEEAARLSGSSETKVRRLLYAAELAVELGQLDRMERLLQLSETLSPTGAAEARIAWIRELSDLGMVNDPVRVSALVSYASRARQSGETELAINLLWRAAQRCWWGNASQSTRDDIQAAADEIQEALTDEELARTTPQLISLRAYVMPLKNSRTVFDALEDFSARNEANPVFSRMLGSAANVVGAYELGVHFLDRSSYSLRDQGRLGDLSRVLFALAWAQVEVGAWNCAQVSAEEGERLATETSRLHWVAATNIVKAKIAAMRGQSAEFESSCTKVERIALPLAASFLLAMLQLARGLHALSDGRPAEAFEQLQRIFEPSDRAYNSSLQYYALVDYVDAAVKIDRADAARSLVEEIEYLAGPEPVPWVDVSLKYARALLANSDDAEAHFKELLSPEIKNWPFLHGRVLLSYGAWLRRVRRPSEARSPLRIARDAFDALAAAPWAERARQELRAAGEASNQREVNIADRLSPQEMRIVKLAAAGLTNKEIAAKLYISHRTVGYHLHRIFPKIGITSRSELSAAVREMGERHQRLTGR